MIFAVVLLFTYALLPQHTEQLSVLEAVLKAAAIRLRPRVMVSVAILIGLMPLALALEAGGEMLQPMAIAANGGSAMEMSGVAVLDAVPVFDGQQGWVNLYTVSVCSPLYLG